MNARNSTRQRNDECAQQAATLTLWQRWRTDSALSVYLITRTSATQTPFLTAAESL
jgi:hypothetical protein